MWTLFASLMKIFRVGHVDPLCMFNEKCSELVMWTLFASLMKIFRVGHVDPLCTFNEKCSELVMRTLYAWLIKHIQNWSCGPCPLCMMNGKYSVLAV